jgi:hypothetical protein
MNTAANVFDGYVSEIMYSTTNWSAANLAAWGNGASGNPNDGSVTWFQSSGVSAGNNLNLLGTKRINNSQ